MNPEDIKIGSLWRNKHAPTFKVRIDKIHENLVDYTITHSRFIDDINKTVIDLSLDLLLFYFKPVYMVEGFEV